MTTATEAGMSTEVDLDEQLLDLQLQTMFKDTWNEFERKYKILEEEDKVGEGGEGVVYVVEERKTGKKRAAKVLTYSKMKDFSQLRKLERQADILKRLDDDGIMKHYDYYETQEETKFGTDTKFILVTELAEGETLDQIVKEHSFNQAELESICDQLLDALAHAHSNGIIHQDVKLSNIAYDLETGRTKLLDFGIAKVLGQTTQTDLLGAGTVNYMAPEQLNGNKIVPETDLYGLGATLIALARGKEYDKVVVRQDLENYVDKLTHLDEEFRASLKAMVVEKAGDRLVRVERYDDPEDWTDNEMELVKERLEKGFIEAGRLVDSESVLKDSSYTEAEVIEMANRELEAYVEQLTREGSSVSEEKVNEAQGRIIADAIKKLKLDERLKLELDAKKEATSNISENPYKKVVHVEIPKITNYSTSAVGNAVACGLGFTGIAFFSTVLTNPENPLYILGPTAITGLVSGFVGKLYNNRSKKKRLGNTLLSILTKSEKEFTQEGLFYQLREEIAPPCVEDLPLQDWYEDMKDDEVEQIMSRLHLSFDKSDIDNYFIPALSHETPRVRKYALHMLALHDQEGKYQREIQTAMSREIYREVLDAEKIYFSVAKGKAVPNAYSK